MDSFTYGSHCIPSPRRQSLLTLIDVGGPRPTLIGKVGRRHVGTFVPPVPTGRLTSVDLGSTEPAYLGLASLALLPLWPLLHRCSATDALLGIYWAFLAFDNDLIASPGHIHPMSTISPDLKAQSGDSMVLISNKHDTPTIIQSGNPNTNANAQK
ncbi:hypothetical protein K438DRAFT_1760004 [Mycena galopus ATCC 62051]|nr:hypothetical protein K438DRAFT_1760004 [Mycena galopus ATCC 62051]